MSKNINKYRNTSSTTKGKSALSFVNLSSYNLPDIVESKNKDWVEFGADNNYFKFLINTANGSATSGACITGISQMIYGKKRPLFGVSNYKKRTRKKSILRFKAYRAMCYASYLLKR